MTDPRTVLLHVSDRPEDIARAIGSGRTLNATRPHSRVRIIVNGPALDGLTVDSPPLPDAAPATIEACEVGLRTHGIPAESLQPRVATTPSAVVTLSDEQFRGAAYVRI